ncbi:MAG: response regulator [Flavobacterium sp.]|nr:MAG: response regulator [Flavobacterium sp.]
MASISQHRFLQATKGKIILGFFLAFFVLLMVWGLNQIAFKKILTTVEDISAPNDRLRTVTNLSHQLASLDQTQKDLALKKPGNLTHFYSESKKVKLGLDTLKRLYSDDASQLKRLKSIQNLLAVRDKQFVEYLKVREGLVNNKSFSEQVEKLNEMVGNRLRGSDSAILTTKTTTSTTTVAPEEEEKSRGFFNRLFGKKKSEVYKIINEELEIKRDTLQGATEDSIIRSMEGSLQNIALEQEVKSKRFVRREAVLAEANSKLTQQMLNILKEVESEVVEQISQNGTEAKALVNQEIKQIGYILIAFFVFTGVLLYFILTDISRSNTYRRELELAKDEAEYHGKAKQRFLSNMSHEIRTPLQSILGYSELVKQQENANRKDLDAIYQSSVHLLQIVNEVLDYNRIVSGELSLEVVKFDIGKLLNEVFDAMQPLAEKKDLVLQKDFDLENISFIEGDAFRLKQVLFNLIGNAVKFTLKGEILVAVSCKQQEDDLHFNFVIQDTGIGFSEDNIDKIFNEFEQVNFPEKNMVNQTGSGLGLSIVKSLIESQGGRINVRSKEGVGTTFTFHLKYKMATQPVGELTVTQNLKINNQGKVWVIDDDRLILDLCGLIFSNAEISYEAFNNATEVLAWPIPSDLKYVLIDMRLPGISGVELCKQLRSKLPDNVKFYAITAQVLPDERAGVLQDGFDGLIMKPFRAEDLLAIFDRVEVSVNNNSFDLSALHKMTGGNEELLNRILNRFKTDCGNDIISLKNALATNDDETTSLIVHRFAGRIGQIGAKNLGLAFRQMEQEVEVTNTVTDLQKAQIEKLIIELEALMSQLKTDN